MITLRDWVKFIALILLGLLSAVLIYPTLHELGHALIAVIIGADVLDFSLFPLPSVLCSIDIANDFQVASVGLSGLFFPFIIGFTTPPRRFYTYYVWLALRFICLISFCLSLLSVILFNAGTPMERDDITIILRYTPQYTPIYVLILVSFSAVTFLQIIMSHPVSRCLQHFDTRH